MTNNNSQKGFAMQMVIAIIALVVVVGGIGYFATRTKPSPLITTEAPSGEKTLPDGTMVKPDGAMIAKYTGTVLAGKSALLIAYNKADYEAAVKSDKLVALYFTANWCPICKVELPNLYAAFNELTTDKVVGFRVDYNDSDTDADEQNLARQLGVAYQHTKVFLKNGKQVLKSPESWSKERNLSEINKALAQ